MEGANHGSEPSNSHLSVSLATTGSPWRHVLLETQCSVLEFPPLLCIKYPAERNVLKRPLDLHGKSHLTSISLQDRNNNVSTGVTERALNKKKFRPADDLWRFSFRAETADLRIEQPIMNGVRVDVLRDLEDICNDRRDYCLPGWNFDKPSRKSRRKLCGSFEDDFIRGRIRVLPPGKAKRSVNFRVLFRKNRRYLTITDVRAKQKENSNKKVKSMGLKRGIGNGGEYAIDIRALNNAMTHTATQQRTRRNAVVEINKEDKTRSKKTELKVKPTSIIKERTKVRWAPQDQKQPERHRFELHHENISCLEEVKNEDDLWQIMNIQHRELTPEDYDLLLQLDESVVPKTVSEDALSSLRVVTVDEAELAGNLLGHLCTVCMEDYTLGDKVKYLPCDHFYHEKCIDNWLTFCDSKCPLDGFEIS